VGWIPPGLQFVVLVAALKLLPATHVRWRPALTGAAVSWCLLELGRSGFSWYLQWFVSPENPLRILYGSLALIPVFLGWIYLVWIFVLLGVEVAHVYQNFIPLVQAEMRQRDARALRRPSVENALQIMAWTAYSFRTGQGAIQLDELRVTCKLNQGVLSQILAVLQEEGFVSITDKGWILSRPAQQIQVADIVHSWQRRTAYRDTVQDKVVQEVTEALHLHGTLDEAVERWLLSPGPSDSESEGIA
jgi:membrane protein